MTTSDILRHPVQRSLTRLRRSALALAAALVLIGCTSGSTNPATDPSPAGIDPAAARADAAFPGLYLSGAALPIAADDQRIELISAVPCAELAGLLGAGQWRVADELAMPASAGEAADLYAGFGIVPGQLLARDQSLAFATLSGDPTCSALISKVTRQDITVEGKGLPGVSPGWAANTSCSRQAGKWLSMSLYFDTDARIGGIVRLTLKPKGDTFTVDMDDASSYSINLSTHRSQLLRTYSGVLARGPDAKPPAGVTVRGLDPGERFTGTVQISSAPDQPPAGTVTLAGLVDEGTGEGDIRLVLPFACAKLDELK
ncbi:MAG TPA: hypothetical protein VFX61_12975 [Micromonosporaceae bacterium]|nr:hypothetical protein [Micromonosporaceae bacterium]